MRTDSLKTLFRPLQHAVRMGLLRARSVDRGDFLRNLHIAIGDPSAFVRIVGLVILDWRSAL